MASGREPRSGARAALVCGGTLRPAEATRSYFTMLAFNAGCTAPCFEHSYQSLIAASTSLPRRASRWFQSTAKTDTQSRPLWQRLASIVRYVLMPPEMMIDVHDLERTAEAWIQPYVDAHHLRRTRDWVLRLRPVAPLAVRVAALTHDMERHFPGGPTMDPASTEPADKRYLRAHAERSSAIVSSWLRDQGASPELVATVGDLVRRHETGGSPAADLIQAADSLSFLETKRSLMQRWLTDGRCDLPRAERQPTWMAERIRLPAARRLAEPLLVETLQVLRRTAAARDPQAPAK